MKKQVIDEIVDKLVNEDLIKSVDYPTEADAYEVVKQVISESLQDFVLVYKNAIID